MSRWEGEVRETGAQRLSWRCWERLGGGTEWEELVTRSAQMNTLNTLAQEEECTGQEGTAQGEEEDEDAVGS